jgi:hypothetical protein
VVAPQAAWGQAIALKTGAPSVLFSLFAVFTANLQPSRNERLLMSTQVAGSPLGA